MPQQPLPSCGTGFRTHDNALVKIGSTRTSFMQDRSGKGSPQRDCVRATRDKGSYKHRLEGTHCHTRGDTLSHTWGDTARQHRHKPRGEGTRRQGKGEECGTNACRAATAAAVTHITGMHATTARAACSYGVARDRQGGICRPAKKKTHTEAHRKAHVDTTGTHIAGGRSPAGRGSEKSP